MQFCSDWDLPAGYTSKWGYPKTTARQEQVSFGQAPHQMDSDTETPYRTLVRKVSTTEESRSDLSETGRYLQVVQEQGAGVQAIAIMVQCGGRLWYRCLSAVARSIKANYLSILNFFINRSTNASAESFNAEVKAFRATSRGVRGVKFFLFRLSKSMLKNYSPQLFRLIQLLNFPTFLLDPKRALLNKIAAFSFGFQMDPKQKSLTFL